MSSKTQEPGEEGDRAEAQHLQTSSLLDFVTPPSAYVVDRALCSAYSAQCAVLLAMLVAMMRQGTADGVSSSHLALARALRRLEGRVHFVLQHGRLTGPRRAIPIVNMLDRFVVPVMYDERVASWHPKVCIVRFVSKDGEDTAGAIWRLWVGSRNFTRDESWDMALALTGQASGTGEAIPDAFDLTRRLAALANAERGWVSALEELQTVRWEVPAGLRVEKLALFLNGDELRTLVPAPEKSRSILAVSPFLDGWAVERLLEELPSTAPAKAVKPRLISTEECLVKVARAHRKTLGRYELLSLPASDQDEKEEADADADDAAEDTLEARGLHAKFIWIEAPGRGELRLGSTNLTKRGWKANAEALAIVSVALPGGQHAAALRSGLNAFTDMCIEHKLDELDQQPDSSQKLREKFDDVRNALVHEFKPTQGWREERVVVRTQAPLEIDAKANLRVGRIGDVLQTWALGNTELVLPEAPSFENGDFLQVELTLGEFRSAWLHRAPFVPSLSHDERDLPLLHSYLGIEGVLALLNDSLTIGGNAGGERRRWDEVRKPSASWGSVALLGIESVLGSWMRNAESLRETLRIVEIAKQCKPVSEAEEAVYLQLQEFLESWKAVEQELIR